MTADWSQRYEDSLLGVFGAPQRCLDHGQGMRVWDVDGTEYLDFLGGIAVNVLGHAHPDLVRAIAEQAAREIHISNYFTSTAQLGLAERILRAAGDPEGGKVFFCNSGTEANEAAFKLARRASGGKRTRILALERGFHGRTMGSLSITYKDRLRDPFRPLVPGTEFIPATLRGLEENLDDTVAALFVEPIQGEAGVLPLPPGFLAAARDLTTRHGILLVVDEVQTGMGRTGDWFAFQEAGILPDVFTLAKGLAGGVPVGAMVSMGAAAEVLRPGEHGSTFGGNPLAMAAGGTVFDVIERDHLLTNARERSAQIVDVLSQAPLVDVVRGRGLLLGAHLMRPVAHELVARALDAGLIINAPDESTVRLAPPLIVSADDVTELRERWDRAAALV
jgi:acetylornithine aminotransferase